MKTLVLKKGKEKPIYRKHPWIFSGAFKAITADIESGDWVDVLDYSNNFICTGHFTAGSIAVRVLGYTKIENRAQFYSEKIEAAYKYRQACQVLSEETDLFRLVFGEGDGLPGLVIDYYNGHCVLQCHSSGMFQDAALIAEALKKLSLRIETIYVKNEKEGSYLFGNTSETVVKENGNLFHVNWVEGQKTGFFIDQRDNRKLLGEMASGKSVLNVFSYTGGFSIYALNNKASKVVSVDLSESAIALANKNAELNQVSKNHSAIAVDAFEYLKLEAVNFDIVVLDPPAFAKRRSANHNAVQGYKRLNALALKKMKKGSFLFTFSCSQNISRQLFYDTIRAAAIDAGREIKVIQQLAQPKDHPINVFHPEGEYLKGLVLYVD